MKQDGVASSVDGVEDAYASRIAWLMDDIGHIFQEAKSNGTSEESDTGEAES